jgi:hypothetical protein
MNLSNRVDVASIKMGVRDDITTIDGGRLSCPQIKTNLAGTGKCKIYYNRQSNKYTGGYKFYAYFDCNGGKVCTGGL